MESGELGKVQGEQRWPDRVCRVGASASGVLRGLAKQPQAVLRVHDDEGSSFLSALASQALLENPSHPAVI